MDELIFRSLKGRTTPDEEAELAAWRAESMEHEAHFLSVSSLLRACERWYGQQRLPESPSISDLMHENAADPGVISLPLARGRSRSKPRPSNAARVGLALGLAAAGLVLMFAGIRYTTQGGQSLSLGPADYITGTAETATVTLGDGSVVRLAPGSRLRVLLGTDQREVWLEGRAFFAVAQNEDVPFVVQTASGRTRVLGTRFDVATSRDEIRVIVVEGRVELETPAGNVELRANELSIAGQGEAPRKTEVEDVQGLLEWLDTFIVFQATPLTEVARELEARFGIEVRIVSPHLGRQTVTAWSNTKTAQDFLTRVCLAVNARCQLSDTLVVLKPNL